ncbi:MAG: LuxR C-terminal-related transcriptional regulator [Ilumatobacteraceae bacterium]
MTVEADPQAARDSSDERWPTLIAIGAVADDLSPASIARYAEVTIAEATAAVVAGQRAGVVDAAGMIHDSTARRLIAELPLDVVAETHAAVARHLFAAGPDRLVDAVRHARAAGNLVALDELVAMADHGGRMSLSVGDYHSAAELLALAAELDWSTDLVAQGRRLCDLATASDGLGDVVGARGHLAHAASLAELAGDPALLARAAVQYTLPVDWYAGDPRASGLLARAEAMDLDIDDRVRVAAARALVEHRIPLDTDGEQQMAWVTRPGVGRTIAAQTLEISIGRPDDVRLLALLAWRSTHRAPAFLDRRRETSTEALAISQRLRLAALQVDAAVWLAVDALESGDRPLFDQALAVARWVAERDGNPRLQWRAATLAAGGALLDGDLDGAAEHRRRARTVGEAIGSPGWLGAELLLAGEEAVSLDDAAAMRPYLLDDTFTGMLNPIARAGVALGFAMNGDPDTAEQHARRSFRQLEEEASYLLVATRLAAALAYLDVPDLPEEVIAVLEPWRTHVAVDSNAWWCDGPVALWLAHLHHRRGDDDRARRLLDEADPIARRLNDVRSMRRAERLRQTLSNNPPSSTDTVALTERERSVLILLAGGSTNPQIATRLAYSVSTIRNDTVSIYRKLEVKGRAEAVARATALGLL